MSTEFERRIKALEKKIAPSVTCRHPISVLINPSEEEIDAMLETLAACPNCSIPRVGTPSMLIVRFDRRAVDPLVSKPVTEKDEPAYDDSEISHDNRQCNIYGTTKWTQ